MKKIIFLTSIVTLTGFFFSGCSTVEPLLYDEIETTTTSVNAEGELVTNVETELVQSALGDTIESALSYAPSPLGGLLPSVFGLFTGGYALYQRREKIDKSKALLSVVNGVDDILSSMDSRELTASDITNILKKRQNQDGTRDEIRKLV